MAKIGLLKTNLIADTDSYKLGHASLINPGLTRQENYGEARVGGNYGNYVAFAGMQAIILKHIAPGINKYDIEEAKEIDGSTHGKLTGSYGIWEDVLHKFDGQLPMQVKAVPEGTILGKGNVLFTIESLYEPFAKVMNAMEPIFMHSWYPTAVLTREARIKHSIYPYFVKSGSTVGLKYAVHDFGFRGGTCPEHSELGGMAHLMAFSGSDNMRASRALKAYYDSKEYVAKSVYATEHSVALSFGRNEGELKYIDHVLNVVPDNMIASIVIDTYDAHGFIRNVAGNSKIKERIIKKEGRVVFRPDSGIPNVIVPQILELLSEIYGFSYNDKGYKVLNHNVGVIQGDGMNETSIADLYHTIVTMGWSADNLVVGSGGGLLVEGLNRDTNRFAIKPSWGVIDGQPINFQKSPTTDMSKQSKPGHLKLHPSYNGGFMTISSATTSEVQFNAYADALKPVYNTGELYLDTYEAIAERFESNLSLIDKLF